MNKAKRLEILTRLRENNPHPTTELNFSSPFELLIAVLLSAQATDVSVNKATAKLYPVANTPAAMLELGAKQKISSKPAVYYWNNIMARFRKIVLRLKPCLV